MPNCYLNLNTFFPSGNYTFSSTIVPSPAYPSGVSYTGTATVSSIVNPCKPYKVSQLTIATTGTISSTTVTSTETFNNKCEKYSAISSGQYYFSGGYKICKKYYGSIQAKYKGFSQNYTRNVKGKTVYTISTNGFTETIYYKIPYSCGYVPYQTTVYTRV